jgi:HEAT repeat protein
MIAKQKSRDFIKSGLMPWVAGIVVLVVATPVLAWQGAFEESDAQERYLQAQQLLNREEYRRAAEEFEQVFLKYGQSHYAADALYWHAFALYRQGRKKDLQEAVSALELLQSRYENASTTADAEALLLKIYGQLAERGDAVAARKLAELTEQQESEEKDIEIKMAALHALINMNSERAVPILKKILQDRDPAKAELRAQAIFLLAQHAPEESVEILMDLARNDPDPEVREQAVFWLGQTDSEQAIPFLEEILNSSSDSELMQHAIFALSQHGGDEALAIIKQVALNKDAPEEAREQAIFMLGQSGGEENIDLLMELYNEVETKGLKEQLLHGVAQASGDDEKISQWFMTIIFDAQEDIELRQTALFWAAQQGQLDLQSLAKLYDEIESDAMREQVVFAISQHGGSDAFDVLLDIVKKEGNPDLRHQLIFWIGQSDDPRAEAYLLEILEE